MATDKCGHVRFRYELALVVSITAELLLSGLVTLRLATVTITILAAHLCLYFDLSRAFVERNVQVLNSIKCCNIWQ